MFKLQWFGSALALLLIWANTSAAQAELATDARLDGPISLTFPRTAVKDVLEKVCESTGVLIRMDRAIAQDSVTCLVSGVPARAVLRGLAETLHCRLEVEGAGYRVRLSPAIEQLQANRARFGRLRDEELAFKKAGAIRRGMERTVDPDFPEGNDPDVFLARMRSPELLSFLKSLSGEQRDLLANGATEPPGVISATGSEHLTGRIYFLRPLSSLPADLRQQAAGLLGNAPPQAFQMQPEDDPLVGITAYTGALGLSFVNGDQVYNTRASVFGGSDVRALQSESAGQVRDVEAAIERSETSEREWLDPVLEGLPAADCRSWGAERFQLRPESLADLSRADRVLAEFARRSKISIIGDSFTTSTFVPAARSLEAFSEPADTATWARRIARAFGRKYRVRSGVLLLQSRNPVVDRAVEPPAEVVANLVAALDRQGRLELGEYARAASGMTPEQVRALGLFRTDDDRPLIQESLTLERHRLLFTLLGSLAAQEDRNWEVGSATGTELPRAALPVLQRLYWTGKPQPFAAGPEVAWRTEGDRVFVSLRPSPTAPAAIQELPLGPRRLKPKPLASTAELPVEGKR